ncbi:MAG TPA: hypothetical protein VFI56_22170 [Vicinamibacterales bacterium]|jgi:hypothetical protein|nr:hypothetical protein [Vicinamibacterales bacterium]
MSARISKGIVVAGVFAAAMSIAALTSHAQTMGQPERFTAMAVNMDRGRSGTVEIVVNRWSTDAERTGLVETALDKGPEKLLSTLQKLPRVGYIRTPESVGWDLHYAHHVALPDGGEQIVIATDRPIGFWEASRQPRSIDYPFTVIEMHVNGDGDGQGTMSVATKVIADKDKQSITLENFGTTPVLLQAVKRQRESQ